MSTTETTQHTLAPSADSLSIRDLNSKIPSLRIVPMPCDANVHGDVFGGWLMAQVDIAGAVVAAQRANGRVATIAVNAFTFKQPVLVGDLLSFYTDIVRIGNTSITVRVEVFAQRMSLGAQAIKVTEATLTYVATDENRRARSIPPFNEETGVSPSGISSGIR